MRLPPDPRRAQIVADNMRLDPSLEVRVLTSEDLASERANEDPKRYSDIVQQILQSLPFTVGENKEEIISLSQVFRYDQGVANPWDSGLSQARDQICQSLGLNYSEQGQGLRDLVTRKRLEESLH